MATIDNQLPSNRSESAYTTLNRALVQVYSLNWEVAVYTIIFVIAAASRLWDLGARVMSHDESLHTYYSYLLYDQGDFSHTPLMHGPLLFHMTAFSYFFFGVNDFSGRFYAAILGIAVVMMPLLFRRWLGKWGSIAASVGLLVSPMLLYYSRYIRHDIPSIFFAILMVYAILQYVDGKTPRRPIWLVVLGAAMSLMFASKEVAFMYMAIFGSFFTFYWVAQMVQDADWFSREAEEDPERDRSWLRWVHPVIGQVLALIAAGLVGHHIGYLVWEMWVVEANPTPISRRLIELGFASLIFLMFVSVGLVSYVRTGQYRDIGIRFGDGLKRPRSAFMLIIAGTILGGVFTLITVTTIDIIQPDQIWRDVTLNERVNAELSEVRDDIFALQEESFQAHPDDPIAQNDYQVERGINDLLDQQAALQDQLPRVGEKAEAISIEYNSELATRALTWILTPIFLIIFGIMLAAIINSPRGRFSWSDFFTILLLAFVIMGIFVWAERRSVHSHEVHNIEERLKNEQEAQETQLRELQGEDYVAPPAEEPNNLIIYITVAVGALISGLVILSRFYLPHVWEYLNSKPIFDTLIVMGSMLLPWTAAIPLYVAGYNLAQIPFPDTTVQMAILTSIPFFAISAAVGFSWNWKLWPLAAVAFWLPFVIFFTTFFTNGNGLGTGVIGSLGYWLEQQGVRRGSQPQYYYTLIQVPVYEYLPLIISSFAAFFGISKFFEFRAKSMLLEARANEKENYDPTMVDTEAETLMIDTDEIPAEYQEMSVSGAEAATLNTPIDDVDETLSDEQLDYRAFEFIRSIPFLQFMGFWGIVMFVALTMAGEKMPWLTSHISIPLIFVGGWYVGRVIERINMKTVRESGWLLMLVLVPVFIIGLVQMFLPYFTGENRPFQGNNQIAYEQTGQWLAALFAVAVTGYFIVRTTMAVGYDQSRRVIFASFTIVLVFVTARHAWLASYENFDYPTEFLVYAHAGPAVKTTMDDLEYIASRHPDGNSIAIVYDDESTWPFAWYLRDYPNRTYITDQSVGDNPSLLENKEFIIVGEGTNRNVENVLGDDYVQFEYIRLWWPMQEYFGLNYDRVNNVFVSNSEFPASSLYRLGMWDIWWDRDYEKYGQAKCLEREARQECIINDDFENPEFDPDCVAQQRLACQSDHSPDTEENDREFGVEDWPVRDKLFVYVRKDIAAQIWDTGLDGKSVNERLVPDPENAVQQDIEPIFSFGQTVVNDVPLTLNVPRDVAISNDGNTIYVSDSENRRIVMYNANGEFIRTFGEVSEENEVGVGVAWGIAVSPVDGNVYVAKAFSGTADIFANTGIYVYSPEGEFIESFGQHSRPGFDDYNEAPSLFGPRDVTVDLDGYVYVADTGGHRIRAYDPDWNLITDLGGEGTGIGQMLEPVGVVVHPVSGNIYVAETWNQRISVYNRNGGVIQTFEVNMWAGARDYNARPFLEISQDGTLLLVSDMDASSGNNGPRVVAYNLQGEAVVSFNAPIGSNNYVESVAGIAIGNNGNIYVVDAAQGRLVVFPPLTISGTVPPVPNANYPSNGNGSTSENATDSELSSNMRALTAVGQAYWQALSSGNYVLYQNLFCEGTDLPTEEQFLNEIAAPYRGFGVNELVVLPEFTENEATLSWTGNFVVGAGTDQENRLPANQADGIQLVKTDNIWEICSPDVFRPGGR